jgi:hypothetical protein
MSFEAFVDRAIEIASVTPAGEPAVSTEHPLLNGVPYSVFRREVDVDERREIGAFFSSPTMAYAIAGALRDIIVEDALVCDPTCGIGDLLLAYAAHLPIRSTLAATLDSWSERLSGFDKRPDLVRLCKARLCLLARARGAFTDKADPLDAFPQIQVRDMFAEESEKALEKAAGILFNPPFGKMLWREKLGWAEGEINAAAIFLDHLTATVRAEAPIAAILPEVLRCGSRYAHFRALLARRGYAGTFEVRGQFDSWADVDVFTTLLTRSEEARALWHHPIAAAGSTVEGQFEVRVGTVVPHRDPEDGPASRYICAKTTPAWQEAFAPATVRNFKGHAFAPPFVAIRRTSSPSDRSRAVGTIITGVEPVMVENHLLVATPRDGALATCKALLQVLQSDDTNNRLNLVMRCRHLTTGAIKLLPWTGPR